MNTDTGDDLEGQATVRLLELPGVLAVAPIHEAARGDVREAEERYEREAGLPVLNIGMRHGLARVHVLAVLKDATFRGPPTPTLYLVEDGEAPPAETLVVEDKQYHVIGVECLPGETPPPEAIRVSDTFFLYPGRRGDASREARFLLPPVRFPELERGRWPGLVRGVVSASPSTPADTVLRGACGFAQDPRLATLILGFDPVTAV